MERRTLLPTSSEHTVNSTAIDGAVDMFVYGPDMEPAARTLGTLAVIGWRQDDTNTMGYMVSLIAALARREYYAQPQADPREAFTRTLHKINEVIDEFFKSGSVKLAAGIFAVAGGMILVSKLDKFKILLARDGQVIDILNNVMLFSKEHLEKRRFSSIISGSVQDGDRLLAYYPSRAVTLRERMLKPLFAAGDRQSFEVGLAQMGIQYPAFGASFVHVCLDSTAQEAPPEPPQPPSEKVPPASVSPVAASLTHSEPPAQGASSWSPRQHAFGHPAPQAGPSSSAEEPEPPRLIPTEFSLGTRRSRWSRAFGGIRFIRLDTRGKTVVLASLALIVAGSALIARSLWFTNPVEEARRSSLAAVSAQVHDAQAEADAGHTTEARALLAEVLTTLQDSDIGTDDEGIALRETARTAMDSLDLAQSVEPSLIAQLDAATDRIVLATWASSSDSLWAVTESDDGGRFIVRIADGAVAFRAELGDIRPTHLIGHRNGVLVLDAAARTILRIEGDERRSYTIPLQETVKDVAVFSDALYALTEGSLLRIADLETSKPVTKQWLADNADLAAGAERLVVDGSIHVMTPDGMLTTYFKGKREVSVPTGLVPSGDWRLVAVDAGTLAVADARRMRVYEFALASGSLVRTLRLDSQQPLRFMAEGPDGSVLTVSSDNRMWLLR